ncbi:MAG: S1 RNA-binding domain-containing protein, partial [Lachnospiraceae bacterium]|nr:S1 RNA-binding domain-containing protein [Lachnospiraceae bacterium]
SDTFEKDLTKYKDTEIEFVVIEYSQKNRLVIGDRKQVVAAQKAEKQAAALASIKEGDVFEGTVKNITDFGVFVDIGDVDGLLHVSEIGWGRAENPKKSFKVGDSVKVFVKEIKGNKIALSKKFEDENPWADAEEKYAVGNIVTGKVARMTTFGAFVELASGVDALLHVSQISKNRVEKPSDVLTIGQEIEAKIVDFKVEDKKISLSMKAFIQEEAPVEEEAVEETASVEE